MEAMVQKVSREDPIPSIKMPLEVSVVIEKVFSGVKEPPLYFRSVFRGRRGSLQLNLALSSSHQAGFQPFAAASISNGA
jgi:hypothetical protein